MIIEPVSVDVARMDLLEQAHEIRRSKLGWAVLIQFTNYEYDLYPTLREATDAAILSKNKRDGIA